MLAGIAKAENTSGRKCIWRPKQEKEPEPQAEKRTGAKGRQKSWGPWGPMDPGSFFRLLAPLLFSVCGPVFFIFLAILLKAVRKIRLHKGAQKKIRKHEKVKNEQKTKLV